MNILTSTHVILMVGENGERQKVYHWQKAAAAQVEQQKINALSAPSSVFKAKIIKKEKMRETEEKRDTSARIECMLVSYIYYIHPHNINAIPF